MMSSTSGHYRHKYDVMLLFVCKVSCSDKADKEKKKIT